MITPWKTHTPQSLHAVSQLTRSDSTGDQYATSYTYWDPVFDGRDNQFLGFTRVRSTTPGTSAALMNTETTYFYGACGADQLVACAAGLDYPEASYRGLPTLTEVFNSSAVYLSTTHHSYATKILYSGNDGRFVRRTYEAQSDTLLYDTGSYVAQPSTLAIPDVDISTYPVGVLVRGAQAHHLQQTMLVDQFGNVTSVTDSGDVGDTSHTPADPAILKTTSWFVPPATDTNNNWIWRPQTVSVGTPSVGATRTFTEQFDAYGNLTDVWTTLSGEASLVRTPGGAPGPVGASANSLAHLQHITYDIAGTGNPRNVDRYPSSTSNNTAGRCIEYAYDAAYSQLLTSEIVDVGDCGSAVRIVTQHGFDRVLGLQTFSIAPDGGRSAWTYDGFSRPTSTAEPDPSGGGFSDVETTTGYADTSFGQLIHTNRVGGYQVGGSGTYASVDTYVYLDAFGRTLQTHPSQGHRIFPSRSTLAVATWRWTWAFGA